MPMHGDGVMKSFIFLLCLVSASFSQDIATYNVENDFPGALPTQLVPYNRYWYIDRFQNGVGGIAKYFVNGSHCEYNGNITLPSHIQRLFGMTITKDGNLAVMSNETVHIIDQSGSIIRSWISGYVNTANFESVLASDSSDRIYVASCTANSRVFVYDIFGTVIDTILTVGSTPYVVFIRKEDQSIWILSRVNSGSRCVIEAFTAYPLLERFIYYDISHPAGVLPGTGDNYDDWMRVVASGTKVLISQWASTGHRILVFNKDMSTLYCDFKRTALRSNTEINMPTAIGIDGDECVFLDLMEDTPNNLKYINYVTSTGYCNDGPRPEPPYNLQISPYPDRIELNWVPSPTNDIDKYLVYRRHKDGGSYEGYIHPWGESYGTSYTDITNVSPGTEVCYQVTAVKKQRESDPCSENCGDPPHVLPPSNVKAIGSGDHITISWDSSATPGVLSYNIFRKKSNESDYSIYVSNLPALKYFDYDNNSIDTNLEYCYKIQSILSVESSVLSTPACASVTPIAAPTNISISQQGQSLRLSWSPSTTQDVTYRIYRKEETENDYTQVINSQSNSEYIDNSVSWNSHYCYKVQTIAGFLASNHTDPVCSIYGIESPTVLHATSVGAKFVLLSWNDNSNNETGFSIEISSDGISFNPKTPSIAANISEYKIDGLSPKTKYYFRIIAYNSSGNSIPSQIFNITTLDDTELKEFNDQLDILSAHADVLQNLILLPDEVHTTILSFYFGQPSQGYDVTAIRKLVTDFRQSPPTNLANAKETILRLNLLLEAVEYSYESTSNPGAKKMSEELFRSMSSAINALFSAGFIYVSILNGDEAVFNVIEAAMTTISTIASVMNYDDKTVPAILNGANELREAFLQKKPTLAGVQMSQTILNSIITWSTLYLSARYVSDYFIPQTQYIVTTYPDNEARYMKHSMTFSDANQKVQVSKAKIEQSCTNFEKQFTASETACMFADIISLTPNNWVKLEAALFQVGLNASLSAERWYWLNDGIIQFYSAVPEKVSIPILVNKCAIHSFFPDINLASASSNAQAYSIQSLAILPPIPVEYSDIISADILLLQDIRDAIVSKNMQSINLLYPRAKDGATLVNRVLLSLTTTLQAVNKYDLSSDSIMMRSYFDILRNVTSVNIARSGINIYVAYLPSNIASEYSDTCIARIDFILDRFNGLINSLNQYRAAYANSFKAPCLVSKSLSKSEISIDEYRIVVKVANIGNSVLPTCTLRLTLYSDSIIYLTPQEISVDNILPGDSNTFYWDIRISPSYNIKAVVEALTDSSSKILDSDSFNFFDSDVIAPTPTPNVDLFFNYPNPARNTTTIQYFLSKRSMVCIEIFNVFGQLLFRPVSSLQSRGHHDIVIGCNNLPTGLYYYSITVGDERRIKSMTILK